MNLFDFLSGPVADALGWTLLHALWQGFALVLPTAVVLQLLRHRSSDLRYRVGVLALLVQLLVSVATFLWYYEPAVAVVQTTLSPAQMQSLPMRWQAMAHILPWHQQVQQFLQLHLSQFVIAYLLGVVLFGLRLAGGWLYLQRLSRTATQSTSQHWLDLTGTLRSALAIGAVVRVRESARIMVPMVVGVLKPVLLLPIGLAANLSVREVEAVLAHELAHIKRHDYVVNLLQSVMEVLYFFHPALWWLSARVREEREHCCDDLAVQVIGGDGRILAQALARVEELRLAQVGSAANQPALAMAFASKRQHLLHRVRRMLGVPTRPFVSNSSLAGLTLATLLLVSVSVYAVQKQDAPKPKPRQAQPHPTRRHKVDKSTEFGISDNKTISYIIWKGQKLPASRVARLQRHLDQVMAGQLSLDDVKQPDRDILLTVIETNSSFSEGMEGLGQGLAQIDYNNIVLSSLNAAKATDRLSVDIDEAMKEVKTVDYNQVIGDAMASVDTNIFFRDGDIIRSGNEAVVRRYNQHQIDSLSQLMAQRSQQMQALQLQMDKFRFPIEEINRTNEVLQWRKDKLIEQRDALIEKHQRLLQNDGKQKLAQADIEKQLAVLEPEIKKLEGNMNELNKQFELSNAKQDELKQPMDKLKQESQQLEEQIYKLSDEISKRSDDIARVLDGDVIYFRSPRSARSPRLLTPPKPPYVRQLRGAASPMTPMKPMTPMTPFAPARPNVLVAPSAPRPAVRPKIAPAIKPAVAPKPDDNQ